MPTTYAHDLFGKKVFRQLPEPMKKVIRRNGNLFRIGVHGPDILFYNIPNSSVTGTGVRMHAEDAAAFFERGMALVRRDQDEKLLAYLLGFGCHYLLDSTCHPFVNQMADAGVISHTLLEKEFDRTLMLETHKDPYHFYPAEGVHPRISYAKVIHRAIPKIRTKDIMRALQLMKLITNCLVYDNKGRRKKFLAVLSRIAGKKLSKDMMEYFMEKDPIPGCAGPVAKLHGYFDAEVASAPAALEELFSLAEKNIPLLDRWHRTYNG